MLVMKLFKEDLPLYNSIVNCSFGLGVIIFSFIITRLIVIFDYRTSLFCWCALVTIQLVVNVFLLGTQDELYQEEKNIKVEPANRSELSPIESNQMNNIDILTDNDKDLYAKEESKNKKVIDDQVSL